MMKKFGFDLPIYSVKEVALQNMGIALTSQVPTAQMIRLLPLVLSLFSDLIREKLTEKPSVWSGSYGLSILISWFLPDACFHHYPVRRTFFAYSSLFYHSTQRLGVLHGKNRRCLCFAWSYQQEVLSMSAVLT